ncbi:FecR family protein [Chitinophaga sp. YIM B06452]|uniref:FecR family protein n=1 Tax=Chitinophaga sp. YIM B06452 TaxID=3082158 RepID=UPI0031FE46CC
MQSARLAYLVRRYHDKICTPAEEAELMALLRSEATGEEMDALLEELMEEHSPEAAMDAAEQEAAFSRFWSKTRPPKLRRLLGWSAAAAVLALAVIASYQLFRAPEAVKPPVADIAPGTHKALLTLSDGSTIALDSAGNQLLQQGAATIQQKGGLLEYTATAENSAIQYNTLRTPRGGQFSIRLPDGTRVWLNAASSLRYPASFADTREVEITGEAYFEVARNEQAPFIVKMPGEAAVEVLGTHFNISAYEDGGDMAATLTEGSVRVKRPQASVVLKVNEQALIGKNETFITVNKTADIAQVLAWKNGVFNFDNQSFAEVMRQLSRWYDVDVVYKGAVPVKKFGGELQRSLSLSQVLEVMKEMKIDVRLEENRKLVVMP